ncbi:MAG: rhomboid family intramembrane serine protease [Flavobacteriaceae bacterium]|nr:rhomboid family intramembrane serine protease [Flavobacteriaceae bacterium]
MGRITEAIKHLIILNVILFAATSFLPDINLGSYLALYFPQNKHFGFWQFVSHMFMHGGFTHILFNMYALWAFGSPLEQMWGRNKFLFFYFSAGIGAGLIYTAVNYFQFNNIYEELISAGIQNSEIQNLLKTGSYNTGILEHISEKRLTDLYQIYNTPAVGASGAIYGVLVAFGMSFPNAKLALIFFPVPIAAKYFIPVLIGLDLFSGVTGFSLFGGGIAHFAHVGGAIIGFVMMKYWQKNQFQRWN